MTVVPGRALTGRGFRRGHEVLELALQAGVAHKTDTLPLDDREEPNGRATGTARFTRKGQSPTAKLSRLV